MGKGSAVFAGGTGFCFVDELNVAICQFFSYHCHRLLNRINLRSGGSWFCLVVQRVSVHHGGKT